MRTLLQGIPLKDKGQTDSYQRIEAPVRGGEGAPGKIPDGGPPVTERQNSLDRLLIQNDQAQVRCLECPATAQMVNLLPHPKPCQSILRSYQLRASVWSLELSNDIS